MPTWPHDDHIVYWCQLNHHIVYWCQPDHHAVYWYQLDRIILTLFTDANIIITLFTDASLIITLFTGASLTAYSSHSQHALPPWCHSHQRGSLSWNKVSQHNQQWPLYLSRIMLLANMHYLHGKCTDKVLQCNQPRFCTDKVVTAQSSEANKVFIMCHATD